MQPRFTQETWLNWLETRYEKQPIQLGLERVKEVGERLQVTEFDVPVILIGGTNGKGSTVHALQTLYQQAGYRVASYTSPHLIHFNERIHFNGQDMSEPHLCEAFQAVYEAEKSTLLTYFEFVTLAALWFFKKNRPDVILLEVGLGGRLDATNIVDADLAILTTIDFDHQAFLGNTLDAIGFEKAGILRAHQPVIFASPHPPQTVRSIAKQLNASFFCYQEEYADKVGEQYEFKSVDFELCLPPPFLHHQAVSASIMATRLLYERLPVPLQAYTSVSEVKKRGRLELIPGEINVLLDVSHNLQSVKRLSAYLEQHFSTHRIHALFSALADKPIAEMMTCLSPHVSCWHIAPLEDKRAATLSDLKQASLLFHPNKICWYDTLALAYGGARDQLTPGDLLVVFGSFLTVSAVCGLGLGPTTSNPSYP